MNKYKRKIAVQNGIFGVIENDGTVRQFGTDQEIREQEVLKKAKEGTDPTVNKALDKLMDWINKPE